MGRERAPKPVVRPAGDQTYPNAVSDIEARALFVADVAGIGVWEWNADTDQVTWHNDLPYEVLGVERSSAPVTAERFIDDFLVPDDVSAFESAVTETIEKGTPFVFRGRIRRPDGELRWVELVGRRQAPDTPVRIIGTVADITESQVRAEANAIFRTFFEQGTNFGGVMALDGTLIEANRISVEACGYRRDEVIGRKFWECGWWSWSPDLVEIVRLASIDAREGNTFRGEMPYHLADGTRRMTDLVISPVRDEAGNIVFLAPTGTDITDRKRAEARDRLLLALEDAIRPLVDPEEITLTAATLLGRHLGVDRCAYASIEPDQDTMNLVGNYLRTPEIKSIVGRLRFTDFGEEVLALMRADEPYVVNDVDTHQPPVGDLAAYRATQIQAVICVPLHKSGRFVAAMAVHTRTPRVWLPEEVDLLRQVAARCWESFERARIQRGLRQSEERLLELNEQLERRVEERTAALVAKNAELEGFSYSISHDMRAPLRAMVGRARMVLEDEGPRLSDEGQLNLRRLVKAAAHMAQLVDDLLQFARLGTRELSLETVDLANLVIDAADLVRADRPECSVELSILCEATVRCDPRFIGMAVHNLLDNACKYRKAGEPARVEFGCEDGEQGRVFYIRDQGIGFDMQYVYKLFVPFERLHREEYAGTGIGLANVRRVIERHGGRIWANGEVGQGATFFFTLGEGEHQKESARDVWLPAMDSNHD